MYIYYDPESKMMYHYDFNSVVPEGSKEIELDAVQYYNENKDYLKIDLDVIDGVITLEKIKEQGITIENLRAVKLGEVNAACQSAIYAGVTVETSEGMKNFSLTEHDQLEITRLSAQELPAYMQHNPSRPKSFIYSFAWIWVALLATGGALVALAVTLSLVMLPSVSGFGETELSLAFLFVEATTIL